MPLNVEKSTGMLEAMRLMDRAVREAPSRTELLEGLLEAISAYSGAHMAALGVRDPDGGGLAIVASAKARSTPLIPQPKIHGFLPDELFPDSLLVRQFDPYEMPCARLKPEIKGHLGLDLDDDTSDCLFVNLPFEAQGFFSGSILLLRPAGGAALSHIRILAELSGMALRDLALREEGERNWQAVVRSLVRAVDAKSRWTWGHSQRVANVSLTLGRRLLMGKEELARLEIAALLHDVGKIGVAESILDKPGRLDPEEFDSIRRHPTLGAEIVVDVPSYAEVRAAILFHHESWDGTGYPEGLAGERIPLNARIIALADVWDAITSERPYRKSMRFEEARAFVAGHAGSSFDPRLVRIFLEELADLRARTVFYKEVS